MFKFGDGPLGFDRNIYDMGILSIREIFIFYQGREILSDIIKYFFVYI